MELQESILGECHRLHCTAKFLSVLIP